MHTVEILEEAQRVAKATYLALIMHMVEGSLPAKDYLWRQHESRSQQRFHSCRAS